MILYIHYNNLSINVFMIIIYELIIIILYHIIYKLSLKKLIVEFVINLIYNHFDELIIFKYSSITFFKLLFNLFCMCREGRPSSKLKIKRY